MRCAPTASKGESAPTRRWPAWWPRPDKRGIGDSSKKAAVGFCFGGGNVLELARSGANVNAVVCLHGDLQTTMPAKPATSKARCS